MLKIRGGRLVEVDQFCSTGFEEIAAALAAAGSAAGGAATAIAPYAGLASAGMTILGGITGQQGYNAAGEQVYQNALYRNAMALRRANELRANALEVEAVGQRQDIEAQRQGGLMASRASAVMGASGAGVDPKLIGRLVGQGLYKGQVAEWNAADQATKLRDEAALTEWGGQVGTNMANQERGIDQWRGQNTLLAAIGKGALSLVQKYGTGGSKPGGAYDLSAGATTPNIQVGSYSEPTYGNPSQVY